VKNLALFTLLCILIGIAYIFDRDESSPKRALITNFNELETIELENAKFSLKDASQIEPQKLSRLLKRLESLNITDEISEVNLNDTPKTTIKLKFKDRSEELVFENLNEVTGGFYLKRGDQLLLIEDTYTFEGFYRDERELFFKRYQSLIALLKKPLDYFLKKRVFNEIDIKTLKIKSGTNREFEVNFVHNTTMPKVLKPLNYINFSEVEKVIEGLSYFSKHKNITNPHKLSQVELNESLQVDVLKSSKNFFLLFNKTYYEISEKDAQILSSNVQRFWDKKINLDFINAIEKANNIFSLHFPDNSEYNFKLKNMEVFSYKQLESKKFDNNYINLLFNIVLSNKPFDQARYVLSYKKQACHWVRLQIDTSSYCFDQKGTNLRVFDERNKLEYYYQDVLNAQINLQKNSFLIPGS
jgi:hypothetical protein